MNGLINKLQKTDIIYLIVISLVLIDRITLLLNFNFKYTCSDDTVIWQGAAEYMKGCFHEPYFFGQNYNFMLEAIFAIPFLWFGVPYYIAIPLSTSIISLFPFFFISIILYTRGYKAESLFFMMIPLLLPIEYGIITSITRGFVTGIFFSSFMIISVLNPQKNTGWIYASLGFSFGYVFNANSLVFTIPLYLFLFLQNYKTLSFYWISAVFAIPPILIEFFAKNFYIQNPDHIVHKMMDLKYSFGQLIANFEILDKIFKHLTPVVWSFHSIIVFVILFIGIILSRKSWKKGLSIIIGSLFILATLGINKINDSSDSIFFSYTRMYIAIPLLLGISFFWLRELYFKNLSRNLRNGLMIIALTTFSIKYGFIRDKIKQYTAKTDLGFIAIKSISELSCECSDIEKNALKYNIDLIIFHPNWKIHTPYMEMYNYACPLIIKKFPKTLLSVFERRTWVYTNERSAVEKNVMICGDVDTNLVKNFKNSISISSNPPISIFINNHLRSDSLLKKLEIDLKRI